MIRKIKDPIPWILGAGVLVSGFFSQGNITTNLQSIGQAKQKMQEATAQNNQLRAGQIASKNQSAIAEERYQNGCLILLYKGQLAALSQGTPIYDSITKAPLPKGTVVCDGYGLTAKLEPRDFDGDGVFVPVTTEEAFTGNKEVIEKALANNKRAVYE